MDDKSKNTSTKNSKNQDVEVSNDQLGENSSEDYQTKEYSDALQNKNKNKGLK